MQYATYCTNLLPHKTGYLGLSPREAFTGRKLSYKRYIRVGFGDYVQATDPYVISNTMEHRTEGAIALLPTGSRDGSVKFLSLSTGKIITRNDWIPLPMPKEVIEHLNDAAKKLEGPAIVPADLGDEDGEPDE